MYLAGSVRIKLEYYENSGIAALWLGWAPADDDPPDPAPGTIVVDDADMSFVKGGSATAWRKASEGHRGQLTWTCINDRRRHNYNWARWFPLLEPRRYEVLVTISDRCSTTSDARYWVSLSDVTFERYVSRLIAFDAVKWEPR